MNSVSTCGVGVRISSARDKADLSIHVVEILLVVLGALLLLASTGAFLLYVPFLRLTVVAVILVGMALVFLLGVWAGGNALFRKPVSRRTQP